MRCCACYDANRRGQSPSAAVAGSDIRIAPEPFRFRVPYGTFLCVSDKLLHGELKLRGMANSFYREPVS